MTTPHYYTKSLLDPNRIPNPPYKITLSPEASRKFRSGLAKATREAVIGAQKNAPRGGDYNLRITE